MKKFSNYAFWVAFAWAVVVLLEDINNLLGININTPLVESIILSICGVLMVLGIVTKNNDNDQNSMTNLNDEIDKEEVQLQDELETNLSENSKDKDDSN